ncbi:hypothetical protein [Catelliglobosispora koreensis]|uniref:hypothetical protein n=1 Tax=Catelliglobosispora koreensis TaxID=129052 RepID=UPI00035E22B2|nr:hypothetical protein [Catelliglobosispora koreensis]
MGLWGFFGRLFGRNPRKTPLDEARAASAALARKGHEKRRKRPPQPNERSTTGPWGGTGCGSAASFDASCGSSSSSD